MTDEIPTPEQQARYAAAQRAIGALIAGTDIDDETAELLGLPPGTADPDMIMMAAVATKLRSSRIWKIRASGVALDENGNEIKS